MAPRYVEGLHTAYGEDIYPKGAEQDTWKTTSDTYPKGAAQGSWKATSDTDPAQRSP